MRRPPHDSTEAGQQAAQSLEDEAVHRAVEGIRRPVLNRGKQVYIHAFRQAQMAVSRSESTQVLYYGVLGSCF